MNSIPTGVVPFVMLLYAMMIGSVVDVVEAHSRWKCPVARSSSTGIKTGPCGSQTNDFSGESSMILSPGLHVVEFEESITHRGAPFRISLSGESSDDTVCVLIDHIPHNDNGRPQFFNPSSYVLYRISIEIPNVQCDRCSLHLSNPMTDKIGTNGNPTNGIGCTDPDGSCFSVYHSCTLPFTINGTVPRNEYVCPSDSSVAQPIPDDWPNKWIGDSSLPVDASVPGVYRRESSPDWNSVSGFLDSPSVPDKYRTNVGICATATTEPIEEEQPEPEETLPPTTPMPPIVNDDDNNNNNTGNVHSNTTVSTVGHANTTTVGYNNYTNTTVSYNYTNATIPSRNSSHVTPVNTSIPMNATVNV